MKVYACVYVLNAGEEWSVGYVYGGWKAYYIGWWKAEEDLVCGAGGWRGGWCCCVYGALCMYVSIWYVCMTVVCMYDCGVYV